ncbi:hypothetical protein [Streptococcus pluranimalium]|uniref:hypothetical protein n=1 Tax=Streptococcus pluranimalium TaxID=82348 RepID=UPI002414D378|nr:hypothetical protein [Streptococcus pluranimalium]MDY3042018.1 hypothetical protein [Streptococcus pluranimalium]WFM79959.1 hypothetical protein P7F70_00495 [Streptococcus pluranimalium]HEM6117276.1 hypothetical protein [Streptococcus suis]
MKKEDWLEYYETVYGETPSDDVVAAARQAGEFLEEDEVSSGEAVAVDQTEVNSGGVYLQEEQTVPLITEAPTVNQQEPTKQPFFKQKKFWLFSGVGFLVLALLVGLFLLVRYQTGQVQGYWRSAKLEKELVKEIEKSLSDVEGDAGIKLDKVLKSETVALDIADDEATMFVSYVFDKEAFYTAYQESLTNSEYSEYLGDEYKDLLKDFMPSRKEVDEMVDEMLEKTGKEEGFDYDSKTGKLKATLFEGDVHRITRTIEITEIDNDDLNLDDIDLDEGDKIKYQKEKSGLVLKGKKSKHDITFKKGKISSSKVY